VGAPLENVTLDEAYLAAGGFGRFGTFMLVSLIMCMNSAGVIIYGVYFMELEPEY
jgi:hypothetical protein